MSKHAEHPRRRPFALLLVAAILAGCATAPGNRAAQQDDYQVFTISGKQSPAVVLQAGLQNGKDVWNKVVPDLSRNHTVFAFDRPGHAGNPATEAPRDPCTIAAEQRALLRSAGIRPPYLLVGHSLGGFYQYVYAKRYPTDVAGIVLLDPTHPRHWETLQQETPALATMVKVMRTVAFSATDRAEFDAFSTCLDSVDMVRPLDAPTRILVSGRFQPAERGDFEATVKRLRQDWLRLTGASRLELILDSSHFIQMDNPDAVVAAIQQVGKTPGAGGEQARGTPPSKYASKAEVAESMGRPTETVADPDSGDEVWIYSSKFEVPLLVSLIPVVGDIADIAELAQSGQQQHELIFRFDKHGIVKRFERRNIE